MQRKEQTRLSVVSVRLVHCIGTSAPSIVVAPSCARGSSYWFICCWPLATSIGAAYCVVIAVSEIELKNG